MSMAAALRQRNPGAAWWRIAWWELARIVLWLPLTFCYRLRAFGQRHIPPTGPVLLISNHQSYLDLAVIGVPIAHRHFHPMARKTLFRNRWFGGLIRSFNAFEVDQTRGDLKAMRTAIDLLKRGHLVLVFPEGRRTPDGAVQAFEAGLLMLIRRAKPTIVPAAVEGPYEVWPIGRTMPRLAGRVGVQFGKPIAADSILAMDNDQALHRLRQAVDALRVDLRRRLH